MTLQTLLMHPAVQSLGWALLHFVWQGALLAALYLVANALTRRTQARLRYAIGCVAMLLMPVMFVASIMRSELLQPFPIPDGGVVVVSSGDAAPAEGEAVRSSGAFLARRDSTAWFRSASLPGWIVCFWLAGVAGLSLYTAGGWLRVQRLRRRGIEPADPARISMLESLVRRLSVSRPVRLYSSAIAQVPTVIGWVRPYILLPVSTLTGLSEEQLQAVLAHELAHIRRYDYLVNLLQSAVETLLFYHPAVWWISRRIREEREHCCDDLAVAVCGDVMVYAGALVQLEELRGRKTEPALAATGGDLLARIRRLVGEEVKGTDRIPGSAGLIVAAALIAGALMSIGNARQTASAQSGGASPAFEAASFRVDPTPDRSRKFGAIQFSRDTLTMSGISPWLMVRWAYGVESFQISGPGWMQGPPYYDVAAKTSGAVAESQLRLMFQNLLGERFHLAVHLEKKEMPVMALLVEKGGPKFHASTGKYEAAGGAEAPMQFLGFENNVHILRRREPDGRLRDSFTDMSMKAFAAVLAMWASRTPYENVAVVDMTGMQGRFDFVVVSDAASTRDNPLAALQRILPGELGLALESRKEMVDVVVVDHMDTPSAR